MDLSQRTGKIFRTKTNWWNITNNLKGVKNIRGKNKGGKEMTLYELTEAKKR